jgi:hypothetical protein
MSWLRAPLELTRRKRVWLALGGLFLVAFGIFFLFFGGVLFLPFGLMALTTAVLPSRWPRWRALVTGVLATPLLVAVASAAYEGYTCARPEPWIEVRFHDSIDGQNGLRGVDDEDDFRSLTDQGGEGYRVVFTRDGADTRDRWARELRKMGVASIRTGADHCR